MSSRYVVGILMAAKSLGEIPGVERARHKIVLRLDIISTGLHPIVLKSSAFNFFCQGIDLSPHQSGREGMYRPPFHEFLAIVPVMQHFFRWIPILIHKKYDR
jgi:hypothetical protein